MTTADRPLRGAAYLLLASVLWGGAFLPQALTVEPMGPLWATAVRFLIAAPVAALFAGRRLLAPGAPAGPLVGLGVILYVAFYLQTAALTTTPVWRVSLLTGTYAVFTPILAPFFGLPRPSLLHWAGVGLAALGMVLLVDPMGASATAAPLGLGDLFTVGHALLTSVHLLLVGRLVRLASPRALNAWQLVVMAACALPAALLLEAAPSLDVVTEPKTLLSFLYLAVFSSTVAFGAQVAGQRTASPPAAAVIMLLEAPIGATLGALVLDEPIGRVQLVGAGVLLAGAATSVVADLRRARRDQARAEAELGALTQKAPG